MADPKQQPHKENYGATDKPKQKPDKPQMPAPGEKADDNAAALTDTDPRKTPHQPVKPERPAEQPDDNPAVQSEGDSNPRSTPHHREDERAA